MLYYYIVAAAAAAPVVTIPPAATSQSQMNEQRCKRFNAAALEVDRIVDFNSLLPISRELR